MPSQSLNKGAAALNTVTDAATIPECRGEIADGDNRGDEGIELLGLPRDKLDLIGGAEVSPDSMLADKVLKAVHRHGETAPENIPSLNKDTRRYLAARMRISTPRVISEHKSTDGTCKWLLQFADGVSVESVFIPHGRRGTLCVSSQVGCALGCTFCSTARMGFTRNLSAAEIVAQLWLAKHRMGVRVTNVVFMGMGEPLLNVDAVVDAARVMTDDCAYGLAPRRVTVSTAGHIAGMRALAGKIPPNSPNSPRALRSLNLAVSLHAPDDKLRSKLMPINRKYPIAELLAAAREYAGHGPGFVVFEYALLGGVNDKAAQAEALSVILADIPCKINLMRFNPFPGTEFRVGDEEDARVFYRILASAGHVVTMRRSRGADIVAACGQLKTSTENASASQMSQLR